MLLRSYNIINLGVVLLLGIIIVVGGPYLLAHIASTKQNIVANGLLADMLITFPTVYYFLIIRPFKLRVWNMLLVISCCCGVAYLLLPPQQQHYITQVRKISFVVEFGVVVYALSKLNSIRAAYRHLQAQLPDTAYNLQQSFTSVLGDTLIIRALACELTVLRFGLLCWLRVAQVPPGAKRFSTHRDSGYAALFGVFIAVMLVEGFAIHLLLMNYSALAAIIVSALTVYGIIFLVADLSAVLKSPVLISDDRLLLRTGMRWRLLTSIKNVKAVSKFKSGFEPAKGCFKGGVMKSGINIHIAFNSPVTVSRLYRRPKLITELVMSIDEADLFLAALNAA